MHILVNVMGRGYDAAQGIPDQLELADSASIDDALSTLAGLLPAGRGLPASCLVVLNGQHCGTVSAPRARYTA